MLAVQANIEINFMIESFIKCIAFNYSWWTMPWRTWEEL